jgi:hypothetical protein
MIVRGVRGVVASRVSVVAGGGSRGRRRRRRRRCTFTCMGLGGLHRAVL